MVGRGQRVRQGGSPLPGELRWYGGWLHLAAHAVSRMIFVDGFVAPCRLCKVRTSVLSSLCCPVEVGEGLSLGGLSEAVALH